MWLQCASGSLFSSAVTKDYTNFVCPLLFWLYSCCCVTIACWTLKEIAHRNRSCKAVTPIWCARWELAWGKENENLHRTVAASFLCLNQNQSCYLVCNCPTKVSSVASMADFFHLFVKLVFMLKFNQICHKNALSVIVL